MASDRFQYPGQELEIFAKARTWKKYFTALIYPYIKGHVLEVGAGTGNNTKYLYRESCQKWVCLEPDQSLAASLTAALKSHGLTYCEPRLGTIDVFAETCVFDTIIYIDVLEHIRGDNEEIKKALKLLKRNGHLIILSPAHNWLMTPFDEAIGHCRRYNKSMLKKLLPPTAEIIRLDYLDCAGLLASIGNKLLLKSSMPTEGQIFFWDRVLVPASTILDRLIWHRAGKSILSICRKSE